MPRPKKTLGRPMKNLYPPRIDATPEEAARAMFSLPADHEWEYQKDNSDGIYRCTDCDKAVYYPDTLYRDGRCADCHKALES